LSRAELDSIILFHRVLGDWVREVHMYKSKSKIGCNYVLFRNSNNNTIRGTGAFRSYLSSNGVDAAFLDSAALISDKAGRIVSNKVGANVAARKQALLWVEDVKNNKVEKIVKKVEEQEIQMEAFRDSTAEETGENMSGDRIQTAEGTKLDSKSGILQGKQNKNMQSENRNASVNVLIKEENDILAQFDNNDTTFWMGDKLDMLIDGEISDEEDKTLDQSLATPRTENKAEKVRKLNLGSIDYSWMESFGCDSDQDLQSFSEANEEESNKTLDLGPIDYSWMESLADDSGEDSEDEHHLAKDANGTCKKGDQLEFSSIDYSWMDSMGCVSEFEEEETNTIHSDLDMSDFEKKDLLDTKEDNTELSTQNVESENKTDLIPVDIVSTVDYEETEMVNEKPRDEEVTDLSKAFSQAMLDQNNAGTDRASGEIVDVGNFCAAWMDCFESISELDNNLKVKLECTTASTGSETDDEKNINLSEKTTKNYLNNKIVEGFGDYSRNTIEEKENDMFKLLEEVLLKGELVENQKIKEETSGIFKVDDSESVNSVDTKENCVVPQQKNIKLEERAGNVFHSNKSQLNNAAALLNGLELTPDKNNDASMETENKLNMDRKAEGSQRSCYEETHSAPGPEDSDSSYLDETEKRDTDRIRNKKQKKGRILKGKLKKDKRNPCRKSLLRLGIRKTFNSEDADCLKNNTRNVDDSQHLKGNPQLSACMAEHSSDWETEEDENVVKEQPYVGEAVQHTI